MFFRKKPIIVQLNGKSLDVGGGSAKKPRNWDRIIGKKLIWLGVALFVSMFIKFGILA